MLRQATKLAQTHDPAHGDELDTGPRSGAPGTERFCAVAGAVASGVRA